MQRQLSIDEQSNGLGPSCELLTIEEDQDYLVEDLKRLPFEHIRILGTSYGTSVEEVRNTATRAVFAKKTTKFPSQKKRREKEYLFNNELNITRSLKGHHHIIRLFATYIAQREFGLILQPAADGDNLERYLASYWEALEQPESLKEDVSVMTQTLERAFGCLANGLAYIHGKGIRHRDLKSANILVNGNFVIITDFGSSKNARQLGESWTEGHVDAQTRRYSPPEVLKCEKRSYEADVYSLGCVFIELFSALSQALKYDEQQGYAELMDDLHPKIDTAPVPEQLSYLKAIIISMTLRNRLQRPPVASVYCDIHQQGGYCCTECVATYRVFDPPPTYSYSEWEWDSNQQRHFCYILDVNDLQIGHKWSGNPETTVMYPAAVSSVDDTAHCSEDGHRVQGLLFPDPRPMSTIVSQNDTEVAQQKYRRVRTSSQHSFFVPGRVFKMLWTESAADHLPDSSKSRGSSYVSVEQDAAGDYNEIRRFVVLENKGLHSQCIPIEPYRHRRSSSKKANASYVAANFGIIHTAPEAPKPFEEENIAKRPIQVIASGEQGLSPESRLNYGKQKSVEHNVKVIDIGMVIKRHMHLVLEYFAVANGRL
ncbi:kinase-like protein [Ophiobolus disseminans]|uniref:Kinase-like protein n=1 Tax=Ophiobolus disseminans TaxID=1469910 RepID=A0A6A6ZQR4_9PLEO|nr:kinase-like protein [Ophiobolus disseminans]